MSDESLAEILEGYESPLIEDWLLPGMIVRVQRDEDFYLIARVQEIKVRATGASGQKFIEVYVEGREFPAGLDQIYLISRAGL